MAVENLTNTTWKIKENPGSLGSGIVTYNINYRSIGFDKTKLMCNDDDGDYIIYFGNISSELLPYSIVYNSEDGYSNTGNGVERVTYDHWAKEIHITGGADVTNSSLISWLESNATQVDNNHYNVVDGFVSSNTEGGIFDEGGIFIGNKSYSLGKSCIVNSIDEDGFSFSKFRIIKSNSDSMEVSKLPYITTENEFTNILVVPVYSGKKIPRMMNVKVKSGSSEKNYSVKDVNLRSDIDTFFNRIK